MTSAEINAHIGRRLRMERRRREITQKELAARCGTSFQQIHKYETGLVTISACMLWTLAGALRVGVGDLFPLRDGAARPRLVVVGQERL